MEFIGKDFMLTNEVAREIYHQYAAHQPIIDYHCHLDPRTIAENKPFATITDLWLEGDHYKWRAMRANGVAEEKITGNAPAVEKFQAWAETLDSCIGNPLYHWTHLELKCYFGITETLNGDNWRRIWDQCNLLLQRPEFSPKGLIRQSNVAVICTTDAPTDTLEYHDAIRADDAFPCKVLPTFRPDAALDAEGEAFIHFVAAMEQLTGKDISRFSDFTTALENRVEYFHQHGGRLADHGLTEVNYLAADEKTLDALLAKKCRGLSLTPTEKIQFQSAVLLALAGAYTRRHWAMQIHFGALRNNNTRRFKELGANIGCDSLCSQSDIAQQLNALLDAMDQRESLPKTILYNLDPAQNDVVASALANFQRPGTVRSPMQFGSGWWFNDTRRGMVRQLTTLADQGLLMNFVGMLTDSRSFVSYPRHDYFRRIFCNLIGLWVTDGEIPHDMKLLKRLTENVCYNNARDYFQF
ncbi:glucuronate isomerase [Sodalis sp. dw_96]|uniref:glucuronate isomerase n=1 Tax=Sodalis sp. dw_96 TaxID=2719794 RepID=UPI001BD55CB4|nr:glucuronate isomerase [Sodalis sp. dw_96]